MRRYGVVKAVKASYGFIKRGTEPDLYFHFSECADKKNGVPVGARVEFDTGSWRDRPMATNVIALPDEPAEDGPVVEKGAVHGEN